MKVQWQASNIVFSKKHNYRKISLEKEILVLLGLLYLLPEIPFKKLIGESKSVEVS